MAMNQLLLSLIALAHRGRSSRCRSYVSTIGRDTRSGALAAPNTDKTDGPLATLQAARDRIRAMKKGGPLPTGGVSVVPGGGTYFLSHTLQLDRADSGHGRSADRVSRGQGPEGPPRRWPAHYRLHAVSRFDPQGGRGRQGSKGIYFRQLFFNGRRQHLARYPNFDPQKPYGGGWAYADGRPIAMNQNVPGESRRTLNIGRRTRGRGAVPRKAKCSSSPATIGGTTSCPSPPLTRETAHRAPRRRLLSDPARATATTCKICSKSSTRPASGISIAAPRRSISGRRRRLRARPLRPTMRTLIEIGQDVTRCDPRAGARSLRRNSRPAQGTSDCLVAGNTIRNVGDYKGSGVSVDGGRRNGVVGNDIYQVGDSAVRLAGGDRNTLTPAENYADNNYIHHTGVYHKRGVGVWLEGVGNRATHNLIHDCPSFGIFFAGNNLRIETIISAMWLWKRPTPAPCIPSAAIGSRRRHAPSAATISTTSSATARRTAVGSRRTTPGASTWTTTPVGSTSSATSSPAPSAASSTCTTPATT